MGNSKVQFLGLVAFLALTLISVTQCHNKHPPKRYRHPCCSNSHCIRVRYDSYTGNFDWDSGCCRSSDPWAESFCHSHPDGYYVVKGFCDFENECYSRSNITSDAIADDKANKVNQTGIAMESFLS